MVLNRRPSGIAKRRGKQFLRQHWAQIIAADFFTVEVWTCTGLTRFMVLFFIDLSTRRVEIAGIASSANGLWMAQIARNLTDVIDGFFTGKRYLIHDRDPLYTKEFLSVIASSGIEAIKLPICVIADDTFFAGTLLRSAAPVRICRSSSREDHRPCTAASM